MKLIFGVTLSLILSNFNTDAGAVDLAKNLEKLNEDEYETKIIDLNRDCMFLILEHLEFGDLLNMAQIDGKLSTAAADVFRHKHSHFEIDLYHKIPLPENRDELLSVAEMVIDADTIERLNKDVVHLLDRSPTVSENQIGLRTGDQVLNTFKHFGHVIKKIKTTMLPDEPPLRGELVGEMVGKLISKYTSESLTEMCIASDAKIVLNHITNPLINVKHVNFHGTERNIDYQGIRFNEIFPSVRRLDLMYLTDDSHTHFNYRIPNLEHVLLSALKYESFFPTVIVSNPQIRRIDLENFGAEFIQNVSILHPQLQELSLLGMNSRPNGNIQFNNVTTLYIPIGTSPAGLQLPRLQSLYLNNYDKWHLDGYQTFLNEHNHLTNLYLQCWNMDDEHFKQLMGNLTNLMEFTLDMYKPKPQPLSIAVILEYLRNHANLKRFNAINFPENQKDELQHQLKDEWELRIDEAEMTFERQ